MRTQLYRALCTLIHWENYVFCVIDLDDSDLRRPLLTHDLELTEALVEPVAHGSASEVVERATLNTRLSENGPEDIIELGNELLT